jgi:hypothetical protein
LPFTNVRVKANAVTRNSKSDPSEIPDPSLPAHTYISAFMWVSQIMLVRETLTKAKTTEESELDPWILFLNAMRSPSTKDRYQTRVAKFFDFVGIRGKTLEQKARTFANKGKSDINWALSCILKFIYFQRERAEKKEISGATVINYTKSIKLFCDMADIPIQ